MVFKKIIFQNRYVELETPPPSWRKPSSISILIIWIPPLVDLTDVTLAFEDANSKPFDVLIDADVDTEKLVNDSLVEILKLRFGWYFEPEFWS